MTQIIMLDRVQLEYDLFVLFCQYLTEYKVSYLSTPSEKFTQKLRLYIVAGKPQPRHELQHPSSSCCERIECSTMGNLVLLFERNKPVVPCGFHFMYKILALQASVVDTDLWLVYTEGSFPFSFTLGQVQQRCWLLTQTQIQPLHWQECSAVCHERTKMLPFGTSEA